MKYFKEKKTSRTLTSLEAVQTEKKLITVIYTTLFNAILLHHDLFNADTHNSHFLCNMNSLAKESQLK